METPFSAAMVMTAAVTLAVSVCATVVLRWAARRWVILDVPDSARKQHQRPVPLLGGLAVIVAFSVGVMVAWPELVGGYLLPKHLFGVLAGGIVIALGGFLDDRYHLPPAAQFVFPVLATLIIVGAGIGIDTISNPFGETIRLDQWTWTVFERGGLPYRVVLLADAFTAVWLLGMMYTTKFLDGLDGLVSGITTIGGLVVFFLSMSDVVAQPETAHLALLSSAAFVGFLFFNWHPARIFLGEAGSLFAGYLLGVLAIISGAKIATTLLIVGIPIIDVAWVIVRRLFLDRRSPFLGDRAHLHLRLIDAGLSHRTVVLLLYALTAGFGLSSLLLHGRSKATAIAALVVVAVLLMGGVVKLRRMHRRV